MQNLPLEISLKYTSDLFSTIKDEFSLKPYQIDIGNKLLEKGMPPLVTPEVLPYLFGISNGLVAAMSRFPERYYRIYEIEKKSGGTRKIEAPRRFLKIIQRWVYDYILAKAEIEPYVFGFVPGRNIFNNANAHVKSKNLMVLDIKDFFPSINKKQVFEVFRKFGFTVRVSYLLACLCTIDSRLPQGAPTSPTLANLAFKHVDLHLKLIAHDWDCVYTRYADDMAFSGNRFFNSADIQYIQNVLHEYGFELNVKKSRILGSGARKLLAGLVVNQKALPVREKRLLWRAIFHRASENPKMFISSLNRLKGIAAYVNTYNPELAQKYWQISTEISKINKGTSLGT